MVCWVFVFGVGFAGVIWFGGWFVYVGVGGSSARCGDFPGLLYCIAVWITYSCWYIIITLMYLVCGGLLLT